MDEEDMALLTSNLSRWLLPDYEVRDDEIDDALVMANAISRRLDRRVLYVRNVRGHNDILGLVNWTADPAAENEPAQLVRI